MTIKIKIVGFTVGQDKSTCYYKVELPSGWFVDEMVDVKAQEEKLGHYLRLALKKSDFVSIRQ